MCVRLFQLFTNHKKIMADDEEVPAAPVPKKVLFVLTSVTKYPDGSDTGFYLQEITHPYEKFTAAGWEVSFASIGGTAACDPSSIDDAKEDVESMALWDKADFKAFTESQPTLSELAGEETLQATADTYDALYFAGGYGTMWDFPTSEDAQKLIKTMYEAGKIVAAVCHGPIVFANVVLSDETKLLAGKECTGFTNREEAKMGKTEVVAKSDTCPGSCEDAMGEAGGIFVDKGVFEENVVAAGNLYTGQNPASAGALADKIIYAFDTIREKFEPPRRALLKERAALIAEIAAAHEAFTKELDALKKDEAAGKDAASSLEMLQLKAVAGRDYRAGRLSDIDAQLVRNAYLRQAAIDKAAADAAAAAAEE